jgi:hypothetical protein
MYLNVQYRNVIVFITSWSRKELHHLTGSELEPQTMSFLEFCMIVQYSEPDPCL